MPKAKAASRSCHGINFNDSSVVRITIGTNITAKATAPAQPLKCPTGRTSIEYINVPIIIVGMLILTSAKLLKNLPILEL